jgi:hypothetical protein
VHRELELEAAEERDEEGVRVEGGGGRWWGEGRELVEVLPTTPFLVPLLLLLDARW